MTTPNLGLFGVANFQTLHTLKACAYASLSNIRGEVIAETGYRVLTTVEKAKLKNPELFQVKLKRSGLLGDGSEYWDFIGDFEIAQQLFPDDDLANALLVQQGKSAPRLLAYVAVVCASDLPASQAWIDAALRYVITDLQARTENVNQWAKDIRLKYDALKPLAATGEKFVAGRQPKALGPLAKAITKYLKANKSRNVPTLEVWEALKSKPPNGLTFLENPRRGKFIEYDKRTYKGELRDTGYMAFGNAVSKVRKAMKITL